ncbi:MAG: galactose oxidase-like domain-containing protein [Nitrospirota bacterium]
MNKACVRAVVCLIGVLMHACAGDGSDVDADPRGTVGEWSPVLDAQVLPIDMHALPTGEVMYWQRGDIGDPYPRLWNPTTGTIRTATPPGYDIFCSGHSFLADGNLLVTGGHISDLVGLQKAGMYNPFTDSWIPLPDMNAGRWYPTNTTLANGDVLVVSGEITDVPSRVVNELPQVWQPASGTWRDLSTAQLPLPLYPFMYLASVGWVFNAGPNQITQYLDTSGTGQWIPVAENNYGARFEGSSVMYDDGRVLVVGGDDDEEGPHAPTSTAEIIDLNVPSPAWRYVAPMAYPRKYHTATILPDGRVLVTSGTMSGDFNNATGAVHAAELWDPQTETWTLLAEMQESRVYHSNALLLPDGRVLVGGGGQPTSSGEAHAHPTFEIFSPPYLFKGKRPTIGATPSAVTYGEKFFVETSVAVEIENVHWIRLPSVTHGFDQNQRINRLSFSQTAGGLQVAVPSNRNLAPPGHYMLFILTKQGVPSEGRIIQITV